MIKLLAIAIAACGVSTAAFAQSTSSGTDFDLPGADVGNLVGDGGFELNGVDFAGNPAKGAFSWWPEDLVLAPIPGYSPQLGWTLALAGGYFLTEQVDGGPPPSILGGFLFGAENGSFAAGLGTKFHLNDDRFRIKAGAGYMDVRYRYYGSNRNDNDLGLSLDILQKGPVYFVAASTRVWRKLYLGAGYVAGNVDTRPRFVRDEDSFLDPSLKLDVAAIALPLEWDSRDHEQFPRNGSYIKGRALLYRKDLGSDFDTESLELALNRYLPVRDSDVLALRAYVRSTGDNAPFFVLSTFGGSTDLRGYPSGRYRDRMMYALQGEYRWAVNDRWIMTGFGGVGEVAASFSDFGKDFLPAAGVGVRFVLSEKHRISLSADIAAGKNGTEFYFGVGEAF